MASAAASQRSCAYHGRDSVTAPLGGRVLIFVICSKLRAIKRDSKEQEFKRAPQLIRGLRSNERQQAHKCKAAYALRFHKHDVEV